MHGRHALKHVEVVDSQEDVTILAEKMIKLKTKTATLTQVIGASGLHGASALQHAVVDRRPDQGLTHVQDSRKPSVRLATHTHVLSGVDGHSGDFAVQHVVKEPGCDTDSAEEVQLEAVSVLEDQLKTKIAMLVLAVISLGEDGVHAVCKELDKCNSSFEVIGAKMNGQTEHEIVRPLDIEEQTLTVWITTNSSQPH